MRSRTYLNLLIFYSVFLFIATFPKSSLNPHFLSAGLNFATLILGVLVLFVSQSLLLIFYRNLSARFAWRTSLILFSLSILSVFRMESMYQYFLYSMLAGFILGLFWVSYNIAHFRLTPKENTGRSSALMFSIPPIISIFVPPLSGFLAEININIVWIATILFSILALFLVNFQTEFRLNYPLIDSIRAVGKVKIFVFIQGFWDSLMFAAIPVYTLFFIDTPLNYGIFLSYLGTVSIIANLILGHISDRKMKRALFLYPITAFLSVLTFGLIFSLENLFLWAVVTGSITFLMPAFGSLTMSLFIDNQSDLSLSFPGRELILAVSRTLGIGFAFLAFLLKFEVLLYILLGFVMLTFPAVLFYRTKISKKFSYL